MSETMTVDLEFNELAKLVKTAKKDWMIYRQMVASILLREDTK